VERELTEPLLPESDQEPVNREDEEPPPCVLLFTFSMDSRQRPMGRFGVISYNEVQHLSAEQNWHVAGHHNMPVVGFVTMPAALWGCAADLLQSRKAIFALTVQRIGDPTYILAKLVAGSRLWGNICMCGGHGSLSIIGRLGHLYARRFGKHASGHV
jgi:hypothetical protein